MQKIIRTPRATENEQDSNTTCISALHVIISKKHSFYRTQQHYHIPY